jgi:hypothetical protein
LRNIGELLVVYQGGFVDHSSNISEPVAMSSAEVKNNEVCMACMTCMTNSHVYMNLNHIEEVEDESKK